MKTRTTSLVATVTLALGVLSAPLGADAQQAGKVARIGVLGNLPPTTPAAARIVNSLVQGLHDLGYVEGQDIAFEWRFVEGRFERFPEFAAELVRLRVDIIVAMNTPATVAAKDATRTIPIVTVTAADPVGQGLVASLARPGGNVTGLTSVLIELSAKQLQLLKQAVPKVTRVAVLWNPTHPVHALMLREVEAAALVSGVQLQRLPAPGPKEFDSAFSAMIKERAGALLVLGDPIFFAHRIRLSELAAKSRLPTMYAERTYVEAGGLMAYGPSYADLSRRAATYVDKILKGAKPGDLPVEQPTRFELVINLKTAKALGATIPPSILIRADQVIQ